MDYKNMIYLNFNKLRTVEEIHKRALDVRQYMVNCQDHSSLAVLEEQAIKAAIMCDHCSRAQVTDADTGWLADSDSEYLVCIRCRIVFKSFSNTTKWINKCPHCGARTLKVQGR